MLTARGTTIAVLACSVDCDYPPGHCELFRDIREHGATISEWPPGRTPTWHGSFLVRNRVIAGSLGVQNGRSKPNQWSALVSPHVC